MKAMKSDVLFDFSLDCLINASNKLKDNVTTLFKCFFCYWQNSCSLTTVPISAHSEGQPRDTLIKSISQCLHVKTKLARTCMFSMRLLKQVLSFALDFFLIYVKMTLTQFLAKRN